MKPAAWLLPLVVLASSGPCLAQRPAGTPSSSRPGGCNVVPDPGVPQLIVGYGSLMEDESRARTSPRAGAAHPVEVEGYERGWFERSEGEGPGTTFLGVRPRRGARLNAVAYEVDAAELERTDRRESSYCRAAVPLGALKPLEPAFSAQRVAQAWIYVTEDRRIAVPGPAHPIVQSYVDVFLGGCLEQEERFRLAGFARRCISSTAGWSPHWVNDRIYPRRPFVHQPRARQIDALLRALVPRFFARIRIES